MDTTSSTYKKDRLSHATHNEIAAVHLYNNGECHFPDWVITAAFYSALNYVKHKIFPIADMADGKMQFCYSFEEYLVVNNKEREDKHAVLKNLVKIQCPQIRTEYEKLMDMCWGARYTEYKIQPEEALNALELLSRIRAHCKQDDEWKPVSAAKTTPKEDTVNSIWREYGAKVCV